MRKARVLIVDDSVVIRRMLSDILAQDPQIEVAGIAANGRIALAKLPQIAPDLLTLDIEMPELDGLGTLVELRKTHPKLPVIMFSTLTERGATATMDALARGASDYVAKPANVGSVAAGIQSVKDQLIPKIKALCPFLQAAPVATAPRPTSALGSTRATGSSASRPSQRCEVVVIGSSTGGPQALAKVLTNLPSSFTVPILVVQHMPPIFTQHLAARLHQDSALEVAEAGDGQVLTPGKVWIARGDYHLEVARRGVDIITKLQQGPQENSCRPAVDVLFRSAAQVFGPNCLAVVLTGMGQDGMRGAEAIVQAGGAVIAQDEASSVVWGMPRAVTEAGLARQVLPLTAIAIEMQRAVALGRPLALTS